MTTVENDCTRRNTLFRNEVVSHELANLAFTTFITSRAGKQGRGRKKDLERTHLRLSKYSKLLKIIIIIIINKS